jgi:hypothetical protein
MKPKSKKVNPLGNPIIAANWYLPPTSGPVCSVTLCLLPDEVLTLCLSGTKAKPLPKTTAD